MARTFRLPISIFLILPFFLLFSFGTAYALPKTNESEKTLVKLENLHRGILKTTLEVLAIRVSTPDNQNLKNRCLVESQTILIVSSSMVSDLMIIILYSSLIKEDQYNDNVNDMQNIRKKQFRITIDTLIESSNKLREMCSQFSDWDAINKSTISYMKEANNIIQEN